MTLATLPPKLRAVTRDRHYRSEWLRRLPGLFEVLGELVEQPAEWVSTPAVWTAAFQCVLKGQPILPGVAQPGIPYSALSVSLGIIASAKTLSEAIELLRQIASIAAFPVVLDVRIDEQDAVLTCAYKGHNEELRADIEVLHLTFLMSVFQWLLGEHIPFKQFTCRSSAFLETHPTHPDYHCPVHLSDVNGCRFASTWLDRGVSEHVSDISLEETLIWLVHDHPEELIMPQRDALAEEGVMIGDKADSLPLFRSVGARQKRRKLVAQCGLTLRDLKQRYLTYRAKLMLVDGRKAVAQIASELGYADEGSFRRLFKRMTGHAPIEFSKTPEFTNLKEICRLMRTLKAFH